jgi:hypothetical protein
MLFSRTTEKDHVVEGEPGSTDTGLTEVVAWFRGHQNLQNRLGAVLRQSIDEVLDGQRTGRYDTEKLEKTEKTYLGTKVEIVMRAAFELPRGTKMDYLVAGHDVDSKFSMRGSWSIPTEAMGHLCLLTSADDSKGTFDVGVIRITPEILNKGRNKDQKTTITKAAKERIIWLTRTGSLPENLLLHLPTITVAAIMGPTSGQKRINELLRRVQGRVIERNTAVTVAMQADGLKRCRDARPQLAAEGIVVLGHQNDCPSIAANLGFPVPHKGTFLAVRLVRTSPGITSRPVTCIDGDTYAVAYGHEPAEPAPRIHY